MKKKGRKKGSERGRGRGRRQRSSMKSFGSVIGKRWFTIIGGFPTLAESKRRKWWKRAKEKRRIGKEREKATITPPYLVYPGFERWVALITLINISREVWRFEKSQATRCGRRSVLRHHASWQQSQTTVCSANRARKSPKLADLSLLIASRKLD